MAEGMLLDLVGVAEHLGLTYETVRHYHHTAEKNRHHNTVRRGDFPPPDARFGRSPVWHTNTLDNWLTTRPGRGAGGGRPRKDPL